MSTATSGVKHLITQYFNRLINGCDNQNCQNINCASCPSFAHHGLTHNQAAVLAIQLTVNRAALCPPCASDCHQTIENASRLYQHSNEMVTQFNPSIRAEDRVGGAVGNEGNNTNMNTEYDRADDTPHASTSHMPTSSDVTTESSSVASQITPSEFTRLLMFLFEASENEDNGSSQLGAAATSLESEDPLGYPEHSLSEALRNFGAYFGSSTSTSLYPGSFKSIKASKPFTSGIPAASLNTYAGRETRKQGLTVSELEDSVEIGNSNGDWTPLTHLLRSVFSSFEALSTSFSFPINSPKVDSNIDFSSSSNVILESKPVLMDTCDDASAQNKDVIVPSDDFRSSSISDGIQMSDNPADPVNPIYFKESDKITKLSHSQTIGRERFPIVNLKEVHKAWSLVSSVPDRQTIVDTLMKAVRHLVLVNLHQLLVIQSPDNLNELDPPEETRIIQQKLVNTFVILYECPFVTDPLHFEHLLLNINRAATWLPIIVQVQLCKTWADSVKSTLMKNDVVAEVEALQPEKTNLWCLQKILLHHITLRCLTTDQTLPNKDSQICEAALVLRIVYYASLLAGQIDPPELLALESQENEIFESQMRAHYASHSRDRRSRVTIPDDPFAKALNISPNDCRKPFIPAKDFINETLNDGLKPKQDYIFYRSKDKLNELSFMKLPFLLQTSSKTILLYYDNRMRMLDERRGAVMQAFFVNAPQLQFFNLRVSRDRIVEDALLTLEITCMESPADFKKQLLVEFEGEQGIDEGGLSKEFFQLITERIFNPDYGMFVLDEETQTYWFNPVQMEDMEREYCLIGTLLGLAIYNDIILDVRFPSVLYRKLVGKLGTFEDLLDARPSLARGLKMMLDYEGDDFEDTFDCTFVINYADPFGNVLTSELKPNGSNICVTKSNCTEYIDLYARFLLNDSVKSQFSAFRRGFQMVVDESPLTFLFRPDEIELLVCGSPEYDFTELERVTQYEEYTVESTVIKNFWTIVHSMTKEQHKQLLQFCTGSDRIPVGGMSKMKFTIARQGSDTDRLPTAHTCFNTLLLPEYESMQQLKGALLLAITYCKGFGMS